MPTKSIAAPARRPEAARRLVAVRNRQSARPISSARLKRLALAVLERLAQDADAELCIHLVGAARITALNEHFLGHPGPTDVITFDLAEGAPGRLAGEIFICVPVAEQQAREFRTRWDEEVARYVVHGILHLMGHDDLAPAPRRRMKQAENRTVRWLARHPGWARLEAPKRKSP